MQLNIYDVTTLFGIFAGDQWVQTSICDVTALFGIFLETNIKISRVFSVFLQVMPEINQCFQN